MTHRQYNVLYAPGWYDNRIHRGIARFASLHNWHLLADMVRTDRVPIGWRGDGIITALHGNRPDLRTFIEEVGTCTTIPIIELTAAGSSTRFQRVLVDNEAMARSAARHFLEKRHKNFLWVSSSRGQQQRAREDGFSAELAQSGFELDSLCLLHEGVRPGTDWAVQRTVLLDAINRLEKPLAVLVHNDHLAAHVMDACHHAGLRMPEDVAIMGMENDELVCEALIPPLSSVDANLETLGYQAATQLHWMMRRDAFKPGKPFTIQSSHVVARRSTDTMVVGHAPLRMALRFIDDHYMHPVSVNDIAYEADVSRRVLEMAIRKHLGQTIIDRLTTVRVTHAKRLLETSETSMVEIAKATGFATVNYFYRVFKRHEGVTPGVYRKRNG